MTLDITKPDDQSTVSELAEYLRETREEVNGLAVSTALVEESFNVQNATTVTLAENVQNAATVTNVDTLENIESATNVELATNVESATSVDNADSVDAATTVTNATSVSGVTNATTVSNASLVTNATNATADVITNVTTIAQATGCTIGNAETVNEFGGVTATASEINNACDGISGHALGAVDASSRIAFYNLAILDGTNAGTVQFVENSYYNDTLNRTENNIAENTDGTYFGLTGTTGSNTVRMLTTCFTGSVKQFIATIVQNNTLVPLVIWQTLVSGVIQLSFQRTDTGASAELSTLIDVGQIQIRIMAILA
jgi:hypothetical protein